MALDLLAKEPRDWGIFRIPDVLHLCL